MASDFLVPDILDMVIDEGKKLLYGSNHVAIRVDLKLRGSEVPLKARVPNGIYLPKTRNKQVVMDIMDKLIVEGDWEILDLNGRCKELQDILIKSNALAYEKDQPTHIGKKRRCPNSLKRLMKKRHEAERNQTTLSLKRVTSILTSDLWTHEDQEQLEESVILNNELGHAILKKSLEIKLDTRNKLRAEELSHKRF